MGNDPFKWVLNWVTIVRPVATRPEFLYERLAVYLCNYMFLNRLLRDGSARCTHCTVGRSGSGVAFDRGLGARQGPDSSLGAKFEAFRQRGKADPLLSHDDLHALRVDTVMKGISAIATADLP